MAIGIEVDLGVLLLCGDKPKRKRKEKDKPDMHRWHITRHLWPAISYGTSKCGRSRDKYIPDGWLEFCFDQAYIYGIYTTSWTVTPCRTEWQECHGPLAPFFFFFLSLSLSLSPNVIHFFFLYSALFLYFPRSQHWSSPPTIRRMKARAQPANE